MGRLAIGAALIALSVPTIAAADDPVAGAWKVFGKVDGKDFVITCHFERHADALGGACFDGGTNLKHPLTAGAVSGDQVKWTYQSHFGLLPFDVFYAGRISGGGLQGTVKAAGHLGTFTAAKQ